MYVKRMYKEIIENIFRPAYGGAECKGDSEEFKICQVSECPDRIDLRAQQCSRLVILMEFQMSSPRYNFTWLPHEPEEKSLKCQLSCRSRETGEIFFSEENLIDGTPCSYGSSDICVQVKFTYFILTHDRKFHCMYSIYPNYNAEVISDYEPRWFIISFDI